MPNPVIPVPVTWAAGRIRATQLRADVSDAIALLSRPPAFAGYQTQTPAAPLTGVITPYSLDTEQIDNYNGHHVTGASTSYYGIIPGWYLAEAAAPVNYTGGAGMTSALIGGVQNGGANTAYGGARFANTSGQVPMPVAAKLMLMQQVSPPGGSSGDYVQGAVYQSSGATQNMVITSTKFAALTARWVAAISGTAGLGVPANPAWAVPPAIVTSAFLNANVRDAIRFLIYPPIMEYVRTSTAGSLFSQASLPLVGTTISLDTATVDNYTAFSTSTNTWTAPVAGRYYCYGCVAFLSDAASVALGAGLTVTSSNYNGGTQITLWGGLSGIPGGSTCAAVVRRQLRLNAGDTIQLAAFHHDTASGNGAFGQNQNWQSRLITVWQGS
jgi:hypothetical protein